MYKEGDILICKKEARYNTIFLIKNKSYKIDTILDNNRIAVIDETVTYIYFKTDDEDGYDFKFSETFYTKEELRLLKLESL